MRLQILCGCALSPSIGTVTDPAIIAEAVKGWRLLRTELRLPVPFQFTFGVQDVVSNEIRMGSSAALLEGLRLLNERTYGTSEEGLAQWRREGSRSSDSFEQDARFGPAMFLHHARLSVEKRLPMTLDY